jgi:mycothiol synthase
VIRAGRLDDTAAHDVTVLVRAATEADRVVPLSEHARLGIGDPGRTHLRAVLPDGTMAGYSQLDANDTAELVVHPTHRRQGLGRQLLDAVLDAGAARIWAHGDHPAAAALARATGLDRVRALLKLARPLAEPFPEPRLPAGVVVRTFRPGDDDVAWLALNAGAFADHPEQGRWDARDLAQRMAEPWFDPAGFFVATRDDRMVGFHWTKVEGRAGEIYVLGIDPAEQGGGLGRALTLTGLAHLRDQGLARVELYVEETNAAAVRLYTSLSFARVEIDVQYAPTQVPDSATAR